MDLDAHSLHSLFLNKLPCKHSTLVILCTFGAALIAAHVKIWCTRRFCHASRHMTSSYFKGLTLSFATVSNVVVTVESICLHFVCSPLPLPCFLSLDPLPPLPLSHLHSMRPCITRQCGCSRAGQWCIAGKDSSTDEEFGTVHYEYCHLQGFHGRHNSHW